MAADNAAARLHTILTKGRTIKGNTACLAAWGEVLEINPGDRTELMRAIGIVMTLPQLALDEIAAADPELADSSRGVVGELNHAFLSQQLGGAWETFNRHISAHSLSTLHFAAKLMDKHSPIAVVDRDKLAALRKQFVELEAEVLAADVDVELRQFLLRQTRSIIRAIDDYFLTGGQRLVDLVDQTVGHVIAVPGARENLESVPVGRKFAEALGFLANAVTVGQAVTPGIKWVKEVYQLLGSPGA